MAVRVGCPQLGKVVLPVRYNWEELRLAWGRAVGEFIGSTETEMALGILEEAGRCHRRLQENIHKHEHNI